MQIGTRGLFAAAALIGVSLATPAQAGIPIPCTGEKMVKMTEAGVKRADGTTVYLGYKSGCFSGEWVGYVNDRTYLKLPEPADEATIAQAFGLGELPEPPGLFSSPGTFWVEWLWAVIAIFGAGSAALGGGRSEVEA